MELRKIILLVVCVLLPGLCYSGEAGVAGRIAFTEEWLDKELGGAVSPFVRQRRFRDLVDFYREQLATGQHPVDVQACMAWHLAYKCPENLVDDPEEGAELVSSALQLLMLDRRPGSPEWYRTTSEAVWIYCHRIGQMQDSIADACRQSLAADVESLLGGPRCVERLKAHDLNAEDKKIRDTLKKQFNLDVSLMIDLQDGFRSIDWRSPYAHGLYWAASMTGHVGQFGPHTESLKNATRLLLLSATQSANAGKIVLCEGHYFAVPEIETYHPALSLYESVVELRAETGASKVGLQFGLQTFREGALLAYHLHGKQEEAMALFGEITGSAQPSNAQMIAHIKERLMEGEFGWAPDIAEAPYVLPLALQVMKRRAAEYVISVSINDMENAGAQKHLLETLYSILLDDVAANPEAKEMVRNQSVDDLVRFQAKDLLEHHGDRLSLPQQERVKAILR